MTADSILLLIGAIMVLVTFIFWVIELQPVIKKLVIINKQYEISSTDSRIEMGRKGVAKTAAMITLIPLLIPFVIDMVVTAFLTSVFSFGGTVGGILGLFISDMFSIIILFVLASSKS